MDESSLGNISNEAPTLPICRVFRLTNIESLENVSCLMMSDTGLYLNWITGTLVGDGDEEEEEFGATEEDALVDKWNFYFVLFSEYRNILGSVNGAGNVIVVPNIGIGTLLF